MGFFLLVILGDVGSNIIMLSAVIMSDVKLCVVVLSIIKLTVSLVLRLLLQWQDSLN